MTVTLQTFRIYYFSEVDATITVEVDDNRVSASATHTNENVPLSDWFHFSHANCQDEAIRVVGDDVNRVLYNMARRLYAGAYSILKGHDEVTDEWDRFLTDFYIAFVYGEWYPLVPDYPGNWEHDISRRLTERFKW